MEKFLRVIYMSVSGSSSVLVRHEMYNFAFYNVSRGTFTTFPQFCILKTKKKGPQLKKFSDKTFTFILITRRSTSWKLSFSNGKLPVLFENCSTNIIR